MIGINPDADCLLDPQQARPSGWCPVCKREIISKGHNLCSRCEEMEEFEGEESA